jgi:hypothetical protein
MDGLSASAIWNFVTGLVLAVFTVFFKGYNDKLVALEVKLQDTRDHITRAEYKSDADKLLARIDAGFDKLDLKLEQLRKEHKL